MGEHATTLSGVAKRDQLRETNIVSDAISRTMRSNRSRDTGPELTLRKALWKAGLRGYRVNVRKLPGSPDIVYVGRRVAIFVHGCFWHRCPHCNNYRLPKTNTEFWRQKLEENARRDECANEALTKLGFDVIIVWECQIGGALDTAVNAVRSSLGALSC